MNCTRKTNSHPGLESLPFECLKSIVTNVNSPEDLESASLASPTLALVINDEVLWRRLVTRNFTPNQIMSVQFGRASWKSVPTSDDTIDSLMAGENRDCNWRKAYIRLLRRFGEQQVYSACLGICENCTCLYWVVRQGLLPFCKYMMVYNETWMRLTQTPTYLHSHFYFNFLFCLTQLFQPYINSN